MTVPPIGSAADLAVVHELRSYVAADPANATLLLSDTHRARAIITDAAPADKALRNALICLADPDLRAARTLRSDTVTAHSLTLLSSVLEKQEGVSAPIAERAVAVLAAVFALESPSVDLSKGTGASDASSSGAQEPLEHHAEHAASPVMPGPSDPSAAARRRLQVVRWIPAGVFGAAVVVLGTLCYTYGAGVWHGTKSTSGSGVRAEVLAAAKACTIKVSSYDYRTLAQSEQEGQACATGNFKADYTTAMDTVIAREAPPTKTIQIVQINNAGIERVSSDGKEWTLLLYGQHMVTNTTIGTKTPRRDKLSVRVTMDKVGGKWLIAKLDLVDG